MTGRATAAALACALSVVLAACASAVLGPTAADAEAFVADAEAQLASLRQRAARAEWLRQNFVTADTTFLAAEAGAALAAAMAERARAAAAFDGLDLPEATARKLARLRAAPLTIAPEDPPQPQELASLLAGLERTYCAGAGVDCLDGAQPERSEAERSDTDRLIERWDEARTLAPTMRPRYARLVEIANAGAAALGHADAGARWRSRHGLPEDAFAAELDRLWGQVRPLHESLHCLVRDALGEEYGTAIVPPGEAIPAHLVGDPGGGWSGLYDLIAPGTGGSGFDLTRPLARNDVDPAEMVQYAEGFFASLGFDPLPATFGERSLFVRPADRVVVCRPGAWNIDGDSDVRVKLCLDDEDGDSFVAAHRALARAHHLWAYRGQDPLFHAAAGAVLPAAVGDAIGLSVTPGYAVALELLDAAPPASDDVPFLLRRALDALTPLPFALAVDRWRWQVFAGEVHPDDYNEAWWALREQVEGIRAPLPLGAADFDPGATRQVAANVPLARDFLAGVAAFDLHRALCAAAGVEGPLHRCSIFGSGAAGTRLRTMMEMGASRPWMEAAAVVTGAEALDASALLQYFAPLAAWLDEQNAGRSCGW